MVDKKPTFRMFRLNESSTVRTVALAAVLAVYAAFGFGGWIHGSSTDSAARSVSVLHAEHAASLIASQADLALRAGDTARLRLLMLDVQSSGVVDTGLIELPGVGVVASTEPTEITAMSIPDRWGGAAVRPESGGEITVSFEVPDRGTGLVRVHAVPIESALADAMLKSMATGTGLVVLLLIGLSKTAGSLRSLISIGSSLRLVHTGERRVDLLKVAADQGAIGSAWNSFLDERDQLQAGLTERAVTQLLARGSADESGLTEVCDAMSSGMMIVGESGEIVYANGAASVLLALPRDELVGGTIEQILQDEAVRAEATALLQSRDRSTRVCEITRGDPGAEPDAELRVVLRGVETPSGGVVSIHIEDITQQRLADRSRNAFVAQATHELRTPLTTIRLYVEQAIDEGDEDPTVRAEALNVINSESRRLERIVADMLCVSEIEAGSLSIRPGVVRTDTLFDDLKKDYKAQAAEKSIELVFDLPPKMPAIEGDRDRLAQALHNIVGNAMKYTPSGGRVEIRAEMPESGGMSVAVTDTGIGIDPDECEQIFDRFYRAKDRRIAHVTGSGLGLALSREIARLHGGDISVDSAIDKGSTFTITIPGKGGADAPTSQAA